MPDAPELQTLIAEAHAPQPETPTDEVAHKIAAARAAQVRWGQVPVATRGRALVALAEQLVEHKEALASLIVRETGKPKAEAVMHELLGAAMLARHFGRRAHKVLAPETLRPTLFPHRQSVLHHLPRGVVGIISPWNFPFVLPFGDVAMALCAGNAVVLKPSEFTPRTASAIAQLVAYAGIDPALVQLCFGGGAQGEAVASGATDMVRFTGSVATGRSVAAHCARRLVPCVLELGGKDAAVVLEDADLDHTAQTLVAGAFANAGQACASVERAYVPKQIFAPLLERVVALTRALRVAPTRDTSAAYDIGPMITAKQQAWVLEQLEHAVAGGATVHCGGTALGQAIVPAIVTGCDESLSLCQEETFGPVLPLIAVDSVEEAIRRANDSRFGLTGYVFGSDLQRCEKVALRLEAGSVLINEVLLHHAAPEAPWGGIKDSGLGHTHSDEGLKSFCQLRHLNRPRLAKAPRPSPFGYPYSAATSAPILHLLDATLGRRGPLGRLVSWLRAARAMLALRPTRR